MIITPYDGRLLVVRQPEHGVQTGLFAKAWGNEEVLPVPQPEKATTLAATHHDDEQAVVDEFLHDMACLQRDLAGRAYGHDSPVEPSDEPFVRQAYLMLQVWDRLSLQFAFRHAADGSISPLPRGTALECRNAGPFRLRLDPYPFAENGLEFPVPAQLVEDRPYADPEDWLATLSAAPRFSLDCTVSR